jgi:NhaP-type Na+/H+ or K+/H+ antiporter
LPSHLPFSPSHFLSKPSENFKDGAIIASSAGCSTLTEEILIYLSSILVLGIVGQWLAWRLGLPSILVLLIFGILAGPVTGLLDPDQILGHLLVPLVSLSVAVILFEGGLNLKIDELQEIGAVVRNLITVGVLVTWILSATAAHLILGLDISIAILFGSILVVTGPTVILPLLLHVRPSGRVGNIAKWEGIMNDPIGAMLAVLVFQAILMGGAEGTGAAIFLGIMKTVFIGVLTGVAGEILLVSFLKRYWIPDYLQNPAALMLVVTVFTISEQFQIESGLFAVTVMGVVLANQKAVAVKHIIEFKENLRVLLIAALFIILAGRLSVADLDYIDGYSLLFLGILMLLVRPAAVIVSTWGARLRWQELVFLSWMAPRGIVAASVSSVFALSLSEAGFAQAERLAPLTFFVIIGTVAIYGIGAAPLACWLGLAQSNPQGVLIVGANPWAIKIAETLQEAGAKVLVVDSNYSQISQAYEAGLPTYHGNIMADHVLEEIDLEGMGHLMALTSNDKANSLICFHLSEVFGRANVYQLSPVSEAYRGKEFVQPAHLRGRFLFGREVTLPYLAQQFGAGARLERFRLTKESDYDDFKGCYGKSAIPMFLFSENGKLYIFTVEEKRFAPAPGQTLIALINPSGRETKVCAPEGQKGAEVGPEEAENSGKN